MWALLKRFVGGRSADCFSVRMKVFFFVGRDMTFICIKLKGICEDDEGDQS